MNNKDSHLLDLIEFLKMPTVSAQSNHAKDLVKCAHWLETKLKHIRFDSAVYTTPGHPVVVGKSPDWDLTKLTVLIYGHYDVQPPEPFEEWISPPFEPEVREGKIYARGATDNKGQILAHILGVQETLQNKGTLPCNVIFLIEGEEEIGSPHLEAFLKTHQEELKPDIIAISDTGLVQHGVPTLSYALRGLACLEFIVHGPSHDLHSGVYGGAVMNPATVAARLIASLHDTAWKVAIPGFYEAVQDLEPWEREITHLATDEALMEETQVPALGGEVGYSSLERMGARPTAEVNGITAGYQGEGSKTIVPKSALVKLTFRLVADQNPQHILKLVEDHLRKNCPPGVRLEIRRGHSGSPYFCDPHSPYGKAAQLALKKTFGREVMLSREGGSIPIIESLRAVLGADSLLMGLASPDCRVHSPNENFPLENFQIGIRLNQIFLEEISQLQFRGDVQKERIKHASRMS